MTASKKPVKSRRAEYSETTRAALLASGQAAFLRDGFQAASLEAISQAARVTRGAFYHHFTDKKALFDAIVVMLQIEVATEVAERTASITDPWAQLLAGIDAYLDLCTGPAYRRLVIEEAPAVLGPARYREIDEHYPVGLLIGTLERLSAARLLTADDPHLLARMLAAMIAEAAFALADAADPAPIKVAAQALIRHTLEAFRTPGP